MHWFEARIEDFSDTLVALNQLFSLGLFDFKIIYNSLKLITGISLFLLSEFRQRNPGLLPTQFLSSVYQLEVEVNSIFK